MLPVSLDCPFYAASFDRLSILYCHFRLIVHLEMPVPSQGHYSFHSFPVVDWFCLFIYLWVLTFPLSDCSEFGNFVITLIYVANFVWLSILCCQFRYIVHLMLPVSLDCPFYAASFDRLSILCCQFRLIVHFMLPISFDCPFYVANFVRLSISCCQFR